MNLLNGALGIHEQALQVRSRRLEVLGQNIANLIALMTRDGVLVPDFDDEVVAGACLTHEGVVRHEPTAAALADRKGGK